MTVIVEWGVWSRAERDTLRKGACALGAAVELRYLAEPIDVLWERVNARQLSGRFAARSIKREELEGWARTFEAPDDTELALFDRAQ
jgi:predicted kinase